MPYCPFDDRLLHLFEQRFHTVREARIAAGVEADRNFYTWVDYHHSRPNLTYHRARLICCGSFYAWMPESERDRLALIDVLKLKKYYLFRFDLETYQANGYPEPGCLTLTPDFEREQPALSNLA